MNESVAPKNIVINKKENYATISVNPGIYSLNVIYSAGYVLLSKAYIILDEGQGGKINIFIRPKENYDLERIALEFHNELLSHAHYSSRVKENHEVVKMIVQRALISADSSLAQDIEDREIEELIKELEKDDKDVKDVVKGLKDEDKKGKK